MNISDSNSSARQSVQQILNKYENSKEIVEKDERFTFQVKQNSPRETFGNQAPRNSQLQMLKEIEQGNISKMLSDFSIVTEQEESMCQNQFNNPIGIQSTQQQSLQYTQTNTNILNNNQQQQQEYRGTFGQNPYFQSRAEVTEIIEKSYIEEDLYDDMSVLKEKVMGLLQAYSDDLKKSSNDQQIKSKIQQDVKQVALQYSQIIDKVNQSDISGNVSQNLQKKEQELNLMSNLVSEFLNKFDSQKTPLLNVSQVVEQKLFKSRAPQNLDLTILPNIPCDETFYQHQDISNDKLAQKIGKLKILLQNELERQKMPYSKKILMDMISNLNQIMAANDVQTVKTIVYKIEKIIDTLPQEDQASIQLYDYMSKAMKATKKRISQVEPGIQQEEKTQKRKFFDLATSLKNKLPADHPGRQQMISVMYDEYVQSGKPEKMEEYIQKCIENSK